MAAILRIIHLTYESVWLDEVYSMWFVSTRGLLHVIRDSFRMDYHPFAYYALLKIWVGFLGLSDFTSRLFSAVLGVCAVASAYYLAKIALRDRRAALLCAFIVAVSPTHLYYSQEVRMYILMILFWPLFLGSVYQCWRFGYAVRSSLVSTLTFAVFAYSQGLSGLFALPILVCSAIVFAVRALEEGRRPAAFRAIAAGILGAVIYAPWLVHLSQLRSSPTHQETFGVPEAIALLPKLVLLRCPLGFRWLALLVVIAAALTLALFRWRQLWQRLVIPTVSLVASFVAVLVLQWLICLKKPVYLDRNLTFLASPLLALLSFWAVRLVDLTRDRAAVRWRRYQAAAYVAVLVIGCGVVLAYSTGALVMHGWGKEQWREAVRAIEPKLRPGDVLAYSLDAGD